jgi:hypothetical protein
MMAAISMMGRQFLPDTLGLDAFGASAGLEVCGSVDSVVFLRI